MTTVVAEIKDKKKTHLKQKVCDKRAKCKYLTNKYKGDRYSLIEMVYKNANKIKRILNTGKIFKQMQNRIS